MLFAGLGSLAACSQRNELLTLHGSTMGTTWSVQLPHTHSRRVPALHQDISQLLAGLEAQLSHWQPDSDLSRFNQAPPGTLQVLPDDLATVIAAALDLARDSQGAFDPALGALVNLWGFGPAGPRDSPPSLKEMAAAQADSGWQRLRYEPGTQRLFQPGGVLLDLSAIAKGHAVDRVAQLLDDRGVRDYLVEIGGELRASGLGPQGRPWRVAIRAPLPGQEPVAVVELAGGNADTSGPLAVATSGSYHSAFEHAGRQYSHSLDPRTGAPVAGGVL
ncbi:MAG: FAD:protein FMN transferase, partial [Lysobacterales bacterium]